MNAFNERPKARTDIKVITLDDWKASQPDAEAVRHAQELRLKQDKERAELLQHFIEDNARRKARRRKFAWLLAPARVVRDILRTLKGAP